MRGGRWEAEGAVGGRRWERQRGQWEVEGGERQRGQWEVGV